MLPSLRVCLGVAVCLLPLLHPVHASDSAVVKRGDPPATVSSTTTSHQPSQTNKHDAETSAKPTAVKTDFDHASKSTTSHAITTKPHSAASASMPTGLVTTGGPLNNSTYFNVTIPEGHLPITPEITPGWGVAGIFLLLTGLVYTLIGLKNRWIHSFLSTAYSAALGLTVLIVYVMNVPISNALQGGYVAAVIVSSCAIAGASTFFKELTEGFACAVGGFCLSMWLLTLKSGGLLVSTPAKAIFMSAFTVVAFAFYFSHVTRDWALLLMISFGGATVTVLGVDCFSKAGMKEFWAYIWNLNGDLFPLGATTYPVTKGIRVETAAIIILTMFGVISQIKLWRIVREKREQRAAGRAEAQRDLEEEEANLGREVEENNAREREHWERTYGGGQAGESSPSGSESAGEKGLRNSHAGSATRHSEPEVIEMDQMTEKHPVSDSLMAGHPDEEGKITVRVAADEVPEHASGTSSEAQEDEEKRRNSQQQTSSATVENKEKPQVSQMTAQDQPPEVVPLPFKIPLETEERTAHSDRSSVATFADDVEAQSVVPRRPSLAQRLSQSSADLLRTFSQKSRRNSSDLSRRRGESSEGLVTSESQLKEDNESLAATVDRSSLEGSERPSLDSEPKKSTEIKAQLGSEHPETKSRASIASHTSQHNSPKESEIQSFTAAGQSASPETEKSGKQSTLGDAEQPAPSEVPPKSVLSSSSSKHSLTRDKLPQSLSRVALSYRTNEWAKHLSNAETPEPDALSIVQPARSNKVLPEKPAPVVVADLQQSAEDGVPASVIKRSDSQLSQLSTAQPQPVKHRSHTPTGLKPTPPSNETYDTQGQSPVIGSTAAPKKRESWASLAPRRVSGGFESIPEKSTVPVIPEGETTLDEPAVAHLPIRSASGSRLGNSSPAPAAGLVSYSSPQTLLGQREVELRRRSSYNLLASIPEPDLVAGKAQSDVDSLSNYPVYAAAMSTDPDDMPLSQRKSLIHQNSRMALSQSYPTLPPSNTPAASAALSTFNSHQPQRGLNGPTPTQRASQLALFRQSVADELRSGSPMMTNSGRETPFASTSNLLAGGREAEVQRNIDIQRNHILNQKDTEAQRREAQKQQKEWQDRVFDEQMRNGNFLDAHREMMRRMQNRAKES